MRLLILFVILSACAPAEKETMNWHDLERPLSVSEKTTLLKSVGDSLINGMVNENPDSSVLDLFHVLDLNGDSRGDILFNGFAGAADEFLLVYLQDTSGWNKTLQEYGHLQKISEDGSEIELFKPEGTGEDGGDSILTFRFEGNKALKISAVRK
ncbi:MAG: hypothetical protein ACO3FI_04310 [Cyclobacteriaceae bacterium]